MPKTAALTEIFGKFLSTGVVVQVGHKCGAAEGFEGQGQEQS